MKKQVPDWLVQLTWFVAGIFATGALWYFISVKSMVSALAAALSAIVFCALAVWLHRKREIIAASLIESTNESKRMHAPIVLSVGEERVSFDELHRSTEYDVVKVRTSDHRTGVMSEHTWLHYRYPEAQMAMQAVTTLDRLKQAETDGPESDKIYFDIIDIDFPDGRKKKIYFDISEFYGSMAHAELDPQSRIAMKLNELYT